VSIPICLRSPFGSEPWVNSAKSTPDPFGVWSGANCHRRGYTAQIYDWRLLACGTGAGGLGASADRHKDSERTWVECDSVMDEPRSVTALAVSNVLRSCGLVWGV
jgi:hypothetical protein